MWQIDKYLAKLFSKKVERKTYVDICVLEKDKEIRQNAQKWTEKSYGIHEKVNS